MLRAQAKTFSKGVGRVASGVDIIDIHNSTSLYRGMKAHYGLGFTLAGNVLTSTDGAEAENGPGTIALKEPGQIHRDIRRYSPSTYLLVAFDEALIKGSREAFDLRPDGRLGAVRCEPDDPRAEPLRRLRDVLRAPGMDPFVIDTAITEAITCFNDFLADAPQSSHRHRTSVRRARDFLLDHLAENVTLDAVADHARADKFHLCRAFSKEIGLPPYAFLTHARIARAEVLLRRGVRPSDIAPMVGFCDQSQMHRHFVRIVGVTPGEYARAH